MKIYLDQNKWIDLARAIIKPDENQKYQDVANLIIEKSNSGEWIFPLSIIHHLETLSRRDPASRERLAKVISGISKQNAILPFNEVQKDEFYVAFAKIHRPKEKLKINAVHNNYFAALGTETPVVEFKKDSPLYNIEIHKEIKNFSKELFARSDFFELFISQTTDDQEIVDDLKKDDIETKQEWDNWRKIYNSIDKQHRYHAFLVRFFFDHFVQYKDELMLFFGQTRETIISPSILESKEKALDFLESIPSLDVRAKLMCETFNNQSKEIALHDHRDIAFLATAIPYCDIVITERIWKHYSNAQKLNLKYDTTIENDLNYLLTL